MQILQHILALIQHHNLHIRLVYAVYNTQQWLQVALNAKLAGSLKEYRSSSDSAIQHSALLAAIAECYKQRKQAEYASYGAGLTPEYVEVFASLKSPSNEKGLALCTFLPCLTTRECSIKPLRCVKKR